MADCYLRKEIGSNVFKKMKDPAQSRYYNIKSSYYDTAWQYGVGQNANQNKSTTRSGGAAGSGIKLPEDWQEQNKASMDKLREQMGTGQAVDYFKVLADKSSTKEEKDWASRAIAQLVQTDNGRHEVTAILGNMFKGDDQKVLDYLNYYTTYGDTTDKRGVPKSTKTEQADVYTILKDFVNMPYLITSPYDKKILESYLAKIETGHPILEKDLPKLQELIAKYNTPEMLTKADEYSYYASKQKEFYDYLKDPNNGLTPSQANDYWTIYNNVKGGKELNDWQRDKLAERFPEYREAVEMSDQKIETSLADLMKKVDEEGQGGSGGGRPDANISDEAKQYAAAVVSGLDDDKVLGQGLFTSIMAVWNKETPAIAPFVGRGIEDAGIFTPKTVGPITYNPITGMAGLSFVPDIPAMVIAPIFKTAFGYDPVTGDSARPTVGDWISTVLTFAGAAEARGMSLTGVKGTVSDFFSSTSGRLGPGAKASAKAANVADDVANQAAQKAGTIKESVKNLSEVDEWALKQIRNIEKGWESIGTKNYPNYTVGGKSFASVDDAISWINAQKSILTSSLDDMARESTKINNYVNTAKTITDDVVKEGAKYGDDFYNSIKDAVAQGVKEGSAKPPSGLMGLVPDSIRGGVRVAAEIGAGYIGLLGAIGFGGFLVLDDQMQFDEFPITNGLENGNFVSAAAALSADQHKHNTWQFGSALLAELVTLPFAAIDKATGLETQKNLPVIGQVITTYQSYGQRGERAAYDASRCGVWVGDFKTGRPATREEIVTWYDQNKNDKVLFPNPPTKDEFNKELKHSYYKAVALNPNYDQQVKNISEIPGTPLEEILGKDKQGGGGAGSPQKGQGAMAGLGVGQVAPGVAGKSVSDRINTLLGDKTLDKFQIRTLGETFKIPGVDQLNNLLNSDKIQEAKEYLSNKLAEVVPGYKPYEKSAWKTPGSSFTPDRSGICLSACQNACQTAQVYRSNNCGSSQFSAFKTGSGSGGGGGGSVLLCGGGEAHGGGECREYGCDAVAESRAILCGEGTSCGSKQVVGCAACESAAEALQALRCGESSTPQPSCGYDLSGYNISGDTTAGGLPVEVTPTGNVPMQYCSGGSEICSQSESCDSSDVEAAQASCRGCETVWQMGCMSKELGMRKKK